MCSIALQRWVKQKPPFILTGIVLSKLIPGHIPLDLHFNLEHIDSSFLKVVVNQRRQIFKT